MDRDIDVGEVQPLLREHGAARASTTNATHGNTTNPRASHSLVAHHFLPIPLLAALAMSSTAATAYFASATLLCKDPRHCEAGEISKYAGFIAVAISASNALGIMALGYLQKVATNRRLGLMLWMLCRSMCPVMLLVGGMNIFQVNVCSVGGQEVTELKSIKNEKI